MKGSRAIFGRHAAFFQTHAAPHSLSQTFPKTSVSFWVPFGVARGDLGKWREDRAFGPQGDIAQGDNADHPLLPVEHRKVMHLAFLHLTERLVQGLVVVTIEYAG